MSPDEVATETLVPQPDVADIPEFISLPAHVARNAANWPGKAAVKCDGVAVEQSSFATHPLAA